MRPSRSGPLWILGLAALVAGVVWIAFLARRVWRTQVREQRI